MISLLAELAVNLNRINNMVSSVRNILLTRKWWIAGMLGCTLVGVTITFFPKETQVNTRLAESTSPYLRAHARDQIEWRLLTRDVVNAARNDNKPILISSGYQSCYWCYRMKVDTFSDEVLANVVNTSFVPILIDREINMSVDQQLQWISRQQSGRGGWPLTTILTPDGHAVIGYNYLNRESFSKAIDNFLRYWQSDSKKVTRLAKEESEFRTQLLTEQGELLDEVSYQDLLTGFFAQLSAAFDDEYGGFGRGEKFPHVPQLDALLTLYSLRPDQALADSLQHTLSNMLNGAMRDHLSGGFFRYADNRDWSSPHYEKMLYSQALLGRHLIHAGSIFNRRDFILAGVQTLNAMVSEFRDKDGLYIAALSAVSAEDKDNRQGGYYLWTESELNKTIGRQWRDHIKNLLPEDRGFVLPMPQGESASEIRALLMQARSKRIQLQDDKKILAWQGLVLSALSHGAAVSNELAKSAEELAHILLTLVEETDLRRLIGHPVGPSNTPEFSEYVYLAQGFVDWWQVEDNEQFIVTAEKVLLDAFDRFNRQQRWQGVDHFGILSPPPVSAIVDDQLPSPSAKWLSLAWGIGSIYPKSPLNDLANKMGSQLPRSVMTDSFFHGTTISTIIARQWHSGKMGGSDQQSSK